MVALCSPRAVAVPSPRDTTPAPGHADEKSNPSAVGGLGSRTKIDSPARTVKSGFSGPRFATTTTPFALNVARSPARIVSGGPFPRTSACPWRTPTLVPEAATSASTRLLPSPAFATTAPPGTSTTTSSPVASSSMRPELARTSDPPSASPITKRPSTGDASVTRRRGARRPRPRSGRRACLPAATAARPLGEGLGCGLALRGHAHARAADLDRDGPRAARVGRRCRKSDGLRCAASAAASAASRSMIAPPRETSNDLPGDSATPPSSVSMRAAPTVTSTRVALPSADDVQLAAGLDLREPDGRLYGERMIVRGLDARFARLDGQLRLSGTRAAREKPDRRVARHGDVAAAREMHDRIGARAGLEPIAHRELARRRERLPIFAATWTCRASRRPGASSPRRRAPSSTHDSRGREQRQHRGAARASAAGSVMAPLCPASGRR